MTEVWKSSIFGHSADIREFVKRAESEPVESGIAVEIHVALWLTTTGHTRNQPQTFHSRFPVFIPKKLQFVKISDQLSTLGDRFFIFCTWRVIIFLSSLFLWTDIHGKTLGSPESFIWKTLLWWLVIAFNFLGSLLATSSIIIATIPFFLLVNLIYLLIMTV